MGFDSRSSLAPEPIEVPGLLFEEHYLLHSGPLAQLQHIKKVLVLKRESSAEGATPKTPLVLSVLDGQPPQEKYGLWGSDGKQPGLALTGSLSGTLRDLPSAEPDTSLQRPHPKASAMALSGVPRATKV